MFLSDLLRVLAARWRLLTVCGIATFVSMVLAMSIVSTEFEATGRAVLLPPAQPYVNGAFNPYLVFDEGLVLTASLVANQLKTPEYQAELLAAGFDSDYAVAVTPDTGPAIVISVIDVEPANALALRDELLADVESGLRTLQTDADAPETQFVEVRPFAAGRQVSVASGARLKVGASIGAAGFVASMLLIFGLERLSRARHARRDRRDDDPADRARVGPVQASRASFPAS